MTNHIPGSNCICGNYSTSAFSEPRNETSLQAPHGIRPKFLSCIGANEAKIRAKPLKKYVHTETRRNLGDNFTTFGL